LEYSIIAELLSWSNERGIDGFSFWYFARAILTWRNDHCWQAILALSLSCFSLASPSIRQRMHINMLIIWK
jgi:hypothetical protein